MDRARNPLCSIRRFDVLLRKLKWEGKNSCGGYQKSINVASQVCRKWVPVTHHRWQASWASATRIYIHSLQMKRIYGVSTSETTRTNSSKLKKHAAIKK